MELWQKIVKVNDIVGTKPMDLACCIIQMQQNKQGRLRKFHDDSLLSKKKFHNVQASVKDDDTEDGEEASAVQAEEKWSKKTREKELPATKVGKYQDAPKRQLKINTMLSRSSDVKQKKGIQRAKRVTKKKEGESDTKGKAKEGKLKECEREAQTPKVTKKGRSSFLDNLAGYAGLKNSANNCWFNATIQALAHSSFGEWLLDKAKGSTKKGECTDGLLCKLNNLRQRKVVDPSTALSTFHKENPAMTAGVQHDAHECLVSLLNDIVSDNEKWTPQRALIKQTRKCQQCSKVTDDLQEWINLILSLSIQESNSVEDSLIRMGQGGKDTSELFCSGCREHTLHNVWSTILEEPQLLIIQLMRFNNSGKKLTRKIKVAEEMGISAISSTQVHYRLAGAILHQGAGSSSGHYTSLVKLQGSWHLFDDERVSEVNAADVAAKMEGSGYVLFFEKETGEVQPLNSQKETEIQQTKKKETTEEACPSPNPEPTEGSSSTQAEAERNGGICCLNENMIGDVKKVAFSAADDSATLLNLSGEAVRNFSYEEIRRLIVKPGTSGELNSFVVNGYLEMLVKDYNRLGTQKCALVNSHHFSELRKNVLKVKTDGTGKEGVKPSMMLQDENHVFVVVHLPGSPSHWCLLYICVKEKRMVYLDPLGMGFRSEETFRVARLLFQDYDMNGWSFEKLMDRRKMPTQKTDIDCGVFVCMYALCILIGEDFQFSQADIKSLRLQMAYEILVGSISMLNGARFGDKDPFCPRGEEVKVEGTESFQQSSKMKLRRRSKLRKPQQYSPSSSTVTKDPIATKRATKRKQNDDGHDGNGEQLRPKPKRMCASRDDENVREAAQETLKIDSEEDQGEGEVKNYLFELTPQLVKEKVTAMKGYLLGIASVKQSDDTPLPHLERHQAWLLNGGYQKSYKMLETFTLAAETFSYHIIPDVMREVEKLFKRKQKPAKGFVPLLAHMENFLQYDLPDFIPDKWSYVTNVLMYEAVTKIIMEMANCSYEEATGIGLGVEGPTKTPYGLQWDRLVHQKRERQELALQRRSKRKQATPKRVLKTKPRK